MIEHNATMFRTFHNKAGGKTIRATVQLQAEMTLDRGFGTLKPEHEARIRENLSRHIHEMIYGDVLDYIKKARSHIYALQISTGTASDTDYPLLQDLDALESKIRGLSE